eukprot:Phypoly_transcript_16951.p1 GENE.Phypoly_transcript_16951~~Phypoly_transcript_16951.p1  ORF type:complete len:258 (-),score=51.41 Phypoly_transcript_16951:42-815(-)
MAKFVDHFGKSGANYAAYRPEYPISLFEKVLAYSEGKRDLAIDVGTGTGQAAVPLTKYFKNVIGFDPSAGQLANAVATENLQFKQSPAEKIDLPSESVDLITTSQAAHWFDLPVFYQEAFRLLRNKGTLAIWGYGTLTMDDKQSDEVFKDFYTNVIGDKYWPPNRKLVEDHYKDFNPVPPFSDFVRDESLQIEKDFDMDSFFGYLQTWSGVKEYREKTGNDPLPPFRQRLAVTPVAARQSFRVTFPIFLLLAKKIVR